MLINSSINSKNINIKFDVNYGSGTELFVLLSTTNIGRNYTVQMEGYVNSSGYFTINAWYTTGSNIAYATTLKKIDDQQWHTILITVKGTELTVTVDTSVNIFTTPTGLYKGTDFYLGSIEIGMNFGYKTKNIPISFKNVLIY